MTDNNENGPDSSAAAAAAAAAAGAAAAGAGTSQQEGTEPQVGILAQYLKDLSFENPSAPQSFQGMAQAKPDIEVNVNLNARRVGEEGYEVVLNITAKATLKDQDVTAFVVEISYAGLFGVRNLPEENLEPFLLIECPRLLFPFARRVIADATRDGGFPPLLLEPIDFVALYRKHQEERQAQGGAQAGSPEGINIQGGGDPTTVTN